ncbi:hypothetical protein [Streptomyces sp. NPDC058625]|uniref:hypothetical protein n=1 Tax=Streptomyces sp. NPDC058625 TaxID=3346564 RepID=UPI003660FF4F
MHGGQAPPPGCCALTSGRTAHGTGPLAACRARSLHARDLSANTHRIYARATNDLRTFLLEYAPE